MSVMFEGILKSQSCLVVQAIGFAYPSAAISILDLFIYLFLPQFFILLRPNNSLDADILESNLYEEIICTLLPFMSGK